MEEIKQLHQIAIVSSPGLGHLISIIELAKRLVSHFNFSITLLLPSRAHDEPTKAQTSLLSSLPNAISYINLPPIDLSHVPTDDLDIIISLVILHSIDSIKESLSTLPRLVAVVTDLFGGLVFEVAREIGVPPYMYFTTNAMYLLFLFHLPKLHENVSCQFSEMADPVTLPGCVPVYGKDFEDSLQDRNSEAYFWTFYQIKKYGLVEGILINTFLDLEPGPIQALQTEGRPKVYPIGPIVRSSSMKCDDVDGIECLRWLDQQPSKSVLFVSFGSGGTLSRKQLGELAIGLEKSEVRFMWVVKCPNDESSFGSYYDNGHDQPEPFSFLPKGFVQRIKDRGLLLSSWAPQIEVLSHRSTGGFLTHCGWNSILESISHAIPMIAWPLYAEQKINAVVIDKGLKVALTLKFNEDRIVEADQIADVVKELLLGKSGSEFYNQMEDLSNFAQKAITDNGNSTKAMKEVANRWILRVFPLPRFAYCDKKMEHFPTQLITEILSRLPVKLLLRFRCVAKSWRSLIDDKYFINLHLKHSLQNPTYHNLMIKDCFLQDNPTINDRYLYSVDFPTLNQAKSINLQFDCDPIETEIVGSCNGLLCLADGNSMGTLVYNPATRKKRVIPVSPVDIPGYVVLCDRIVYGFGYDHVNDDYKLLRIIQSREKTIDFHVTEVKLYSLNSNCWKRVRDFPSEYYISYGMCWGVHVNGCLHWLAIRKPQSDGTKEIVAFDLRTEEYKVVPQPKYSRGAKEFFVIEGVLDGCLMMQALYPKIRTDVWIMKEYGVKESWTKLFTIPQYECIGFYEALKPITYSKKSGSEEVLVEKNFKELIWIDVKRRRARTVKAVGIPWSFDAVLLVESLVPLGNHKKKKPVKKSNKSVPSQKGQPGKSSNLLASFPEKVLCHIFSRLPVKTLLQVQRVCKKWYNLMNGTEFIKMHLEGPRKCNSDLSLILKGDSFFSVNVQLLDKAIKVNHPLLCNEEYTDIIGCCNGLVCLCKGLNFALWNPWTGKHEKVPCPNFQLVHSSNTFHCLNHGFGYDPTTDDYKIVSILQQQSRLKGGTIDTEVQVFSLKTKSWKCMQHFPYFICYPSSGVLTNGAFHWVARQIPDLYSSSNLLLAFDLGAEKCRVVTQPNYVDTDFHMSLALLGDRLCFLCHYPKENFDLWVMTDYLNESWTKLVSISQPSVIRSFLYMKPLAYSEDGSEVLFEQDNEKLVWYNLTKKTVKYVNILSLPKEFDTVICSGSLVPVGNATRKYQVVDDKPSEKVQKSRNKKGRDDFLTKGFKLKL
ncbi:Hydroquinone glucosyltransferase [Bienertia sinuspersici]